MKVVFVTSVPASLQFLKGHVRFLQSKGVEIHAISSPAPALDAFGEAHGVATYGIRMERRITPLRDLVALFQLVHRLRRIRPDIVHAHTPKAGLLAMIAATIARVPIRLYHIHGLPLATARGTKRRVLRQCDVVACRLAQQVFCVSQSLRQEVIRERICADLKLSVLERGTIDGIDAAGQYNPDRAPANEVAALRRSLNLPADARVLGFVGRIVADKGIHELLAAFARLEREFPDLHLLVVGASDTENPISTAAQSLLDNHPKIRLAGFTEDPAIYYAAMDVLALPTHREGFGLVAAEAAAMRVPVVATRIPGCVDAVQDGVHGFLVTPGDAEDLADAVGRYLRDSGLRRLHGAAGRERMLRDFQPAKIHRALWQRYVHWTRAMATTSPSHPIGELWPAENEPLRLNGALSHVGENDVHCVHVHR